MALSDNLVRYFKCDDDAGNTTVTDATGTEDAVASTNTSTLHDASGILGSAFSLNGSSQDFRKTSTSLNFSGTNNFTFNIWVYKTSNGSANAMAYSPDGNSNFFQIQPYSGADNHTYFYRGGTGIDSTVISLNAWHMLTMTYDGSNIRSYIDGSESSGSPVANSTSHTNGTDNLYVGSKNHSTGWFPGKVDAVGIWTRALSGSEITSLYNSGAGLDYPFPATSAPSSPTTMMMGV